MSGKTEISKSIEQRVVRLKAQINSGWKKSVAGILEMAASLTELRELVERQTFLEIINSEIGMSEVQALRLIKVHLRFGKTKSCILLESRPSTLYLLAASADLDLVERLAKGKAVLVAGKRKRLDEITVREAARIHSRTTRSRKLQSRADDHRRLATLCEGLVDWTTSFKAQRHPIEGRTIGLLKNYIKEAQKCLAAAEQLL